jgi:hypothetical protein
VTIQFDTDFEARSAAAPEGLCRRRQGWLLRAVAHVSFPGIGQLRPDGKGYRWLPVNYSGNK